MIIEMVLKNGWWVYKSAMPQYTRDYTLQDHANTDWSMGL